MIKTALKTPTVMLIDDQKDWLMINRRALVKAGYPCETFTLAKDALEAFSSNPNSYPIIILDINLGPQPNGIKIAAKIYKIKKTAQVIFISTKETVTGSNKNEFAKIIKKHGLKYYTKGSEDAASIVQIVKQFEFHSDPQISGQALSQTHNLPGALLLWELTKTDEDK